MTIESAKSAGPTLPAGERACAACSRKVVIHARGLCGNCYRTHREQFPRTKKYRPYSAAERDFIRRNWGKLSPKDVAEKLGRQVRDIYSAALRFGAARPRRVLKTNPVLRRRLVKLHGKGFSDREIGHTVGISHATVGRWLRRIGLPSNCRTVPTDPFPERTRQKQREAAYKRIREDGLEFAVPFLQKHLDGRIEAIRMGWPQAGTLLEARILESLHERGASTLLQIVGDVGDRACHWVGTVLRGLRNRGLVAVLYRQGRECVYGLAFGLRKKWETAE